MSKHRVEMINGVLYAADECWSCGRKKPRTIGESLETLANCNTWTCIFCKAENRIDLSEGVEISHPLCL